VVVVAPPGSVSAPHGLLIGNGNGGVAVAIGNDECRQPAFSSSNDEGSPVLAASVCCTTSMMDKEEYAGGEWCKILRSSKILIDERIDD
jgi:hypothetical protein